MTKLLALLPVAVLLGWITRGLWEHQPIDKASYGLKEHNLWAVDVHGDPISVGDNVTNLA